MYKLLIYQWDELNEIEMRCYVFEFNTNAAAQKAAEFFTRGDLYWAVIEDIRM